MSRWRRRDARLLTELHALAAAQAEQISTLTDLVSSLHSRLDAMARRAPTP